MIEAEGQKPVLLDSKPYKLVSCNEYSGKYDEGFNNVGWWGDEAGHGRSRSKTMNEPTGWYEPSDP